MSVQETLRQHNILKAKFARDFNLSRPTFYEYINKFDNNEKLPKEKYQIIFDSLFKEQLSHDDFMNRYDSFAQIYKRDLVMKLADLDPHNTDSITRIVEELKMSVNPSDGKSSVIPFIEFVVTHYNSNKIANGLLLYFNELNGFTDSLTGLSDEDKWYLGNLYHVNNKYLNGNISGDSHFQEFVDKRENLKIEKSSKRREIEKELRLALSPYITDAIKNAPEGTDNSEIIQKILEKINSNK